MEKLSNTIIYLIGFAGVGKLTIAKEISKLTGAVVVDNHLTNNPIFSVIKNDGIAPLPPSVWEKTRAIRRIVIEAIHEISPDDMSFIFTNELFETKSHHKLFNEIADLAALRNARFITIRLLCDQEEICKRIVSKNRKKLMKAIDPEAARAKFQKHDILSPENANTHSINVTKLEAKQVALKILSILALTQ